MYNTTLNDISNKQKHVLGVRLGHTSRSKPYCDLTVVYRSRTYLNVPIALNRS